MAMGISTCRKWSSHYPRCCRGSFLLGTNCDLTTLASLAVLYTTPCVEVYVQYNYYTSYRLKIEWCMQMTCCLQRWLPLSPRGLSGHRGDSEDWSRLWRRRKEWSGALRPAPPHGGPSLPSGKFLLLNTVHFCVQKNAERTHKQSEHTRGVSPELLPQYNQLYEYKGQLTKRRARLRVQPPKRAVGIFTNTLYAVHARVRQNCEPPYALQRPVIGLPSQPRVCGYTGDTNNWS